MQRKDNLTWHAQAFNLQRQWDSFITQVRITLCENRSWIFSRLFLWPFLRTNPRRILRGYSWVRPIVKSCQCKGFLWIKGSFYWSYLHRSLAGPPHRTHPWPAPRISDYWAEWKEVNGTQVKLNLSEERKNTSVKLYKHTYRLEFLLCCFGQFW